VEGNLLAETPDVHWPTPHGEYYLRGGHRLWIAPEDAFYVCPEGDVDVIAEGSNVILRSGIDASGLEKEISFRLDQNRVSLTHRVAWHGKGSLELAPWSITQLRLGGMAILPLSSAKGLLPNRNLVLWPYARMNDERVEWHDDVILLHGRAAEQAFKIGNYNSHGWIACMWDKVLFIKHFSTDRTCNYPDMGANAEAYVKDVCLELETLGPLTLLQPRESVALEETWEVSTGEYAATLEEARKISRQCS
jgi:hypothetical protein